MVGGDDAVKECVEIVEEVDHLERRALRRQVGEVDNVREIDGHCVKPLSSYRLPMLQILRYRPKKEHHFVKLATSGTKITWIAFLILFTMVYFVVTILKVKLKISN